MNTIFSDFSKDVDLSVFRESNKDPKTPLRRHYLSLVGLLEYVDILNGDLPGHALPKGMTVDDVKRMVSHAIGDLDTREAISADGSLPEHEYVDLGLPSGTLWATENINDANGNTLYFAWGETHGYTKEQIGNEEGKRAFDDDDYELGPIDMDDKPNYGTKKYNQNDGLTVLKPEDDAATVNWGKEWKMPTSEQIEELIANTRAYRVEDDKVPYFKLISKVKGYTDKFIFIPITRSLYDDITKPVGSIGEFWSTSLDSENVYRAMSYQCINTPGAVTPMAMLNYRYRGIPVRPVRTQGIDRTQGTQGTEGTQGTQGTQGTEGTQSTQGTQGTQGTEGTQGTQGTEGA